VRSTDAAYLTDPKQRLRLIAAAREAACAWSDQDCHRADLTIAAAVLGEAARPLAAINICGPSSRWTVNERRAKLSPPLLETAGAASGGNSRQRR